MKALLPKAKNSFLHRVGRDAYVDWAITLAIGLGVALYLVYIGVFSFINMEKKLTKRAASLRPQPPLTLDSAAMQRVLSEYEFRGNERETIIRRYAGPSDPGI